MLLFVGYPNVGKSSLINGLMGRKVIWSIMAVIYITLSNDLLNAYVSTRFTQLPASNIRSRIYLVGHGILVPNARVIRFKQSLWRNTETKEELPWCERAAQYVSQLALRVASYEALACKTPRPYALAGRRTRSLIRLSHRMQIVPLFYIKKRKEWINRLSDS
jgi:50S ribosome-binding GTPase